MTQQSHAISDRKSEHLDRCASGEVDFRDKSTLLDQVQLLHEALPDRHFESVTLDVQLLGKKLRAPIVISGMTGGTAEAEIINRELATVAEELGLAFGIGSQRPMLVAPATSRSYQVRDVAPNVLLLGNIGVIQARELKTAVLEQLCSSVGADALCVHLNPAMELVQPGGDRDFRDGAATIARLVRELDYPIIVKETGCGVSRSTGVRLRELGVQYLDVGGAGGTSWVGVEAKRAIDSARELGEELWDWGIPTAVSIAANADLGFEIIATGGLRTGMDAAKALCLGAAAAGFAAPVLRAHRQGGMEAVRAYLKQVIGTLQAVTFLTGCSGIRALAQCARVESPVLQAWLRACSVGDVVARPAAI